MWILVPFVLQLLAMAFDEGYFHIKRGLPKWERLGHPIDTCSVLVCIGFVLFVPFSMNSLWIYIALASFSSILVTKDEFVHKEYCPAAENWLHAVLFTLHPITLILAGFMWPVTQNIEVASWISKWMISPNRLHLFLQTQFILTTLFMFYQIIFWNFLCKEKAAE